MRPPLLLALTALVCALVLPGAAVALPGDPPVEARGPDDGATVPANADGIGVSFTCPQYREQVYGDPDDPITDTGGPEDYLVRFSSGSTRGSDGLLAETPYGSDASSRDLGDGTCTAELDTYDTASSPEVVGGRVFWQAYRPCIGCEGQRPETGPVRSFVVKPSITATLAVPKRLYGGFLGVFTVRSQAPVSGARVVLERRVGRRWRALTDEGYVTDATELFAKLPAGRQTVRARIRTSGSTFTVATRTLTVRREGRRTTGAGDDGRYRNAKRENNTLAVTVGRAGRVIRAFRASVTTFCIGPSLPDNRLLVVAALLKRVRVAPDGGVVGVLRTKRGGREVLTGRLRNGRFKGTIDVSLSSCNGARKFTAVHR